MTVESELVETISCFGIKPYEVEKRIDEYGVEYVAEALRQVQALPQVPGSPFGWMISQLRSGRIQAEVGAASKNAEKVSDMAARYCYAMHLPGRDGAPKRLHAHEIKDPELAAIAASFPDDALICPVCGKEATA